MDFMTYGEYLDYLRKKVKECDEDIEMMVRAMDTEWGKTSIKSDIEKLKKCWIDEIERIEQLKGGH